MMFPFNIGIKLYSTETGLIPEVEDLIKKNFLSYVELYVIPGSYKITEKRWKSVDFPFIIHAPHTAHNVNIAKPELRESNMKAYQEVKDFCDLLKSPYIVVHGGSDGSLEETIHQLGLIGDDRVRLENKPKVGLNGEVCRGCSPEEFEKIFKAGVLRGMVLDFGHAIYYAAHCKVNYRNIIEDFMDYRPSIFHLSDGIYLSHMDVHLNIGRGDFNLKELLDFIPQHAKLTLETPRVSKKNLYEFSNDVELLMNIFKR